MEARVISEREVWAAQERWGHGVVEVGKAHIERREYVSLAAKLLVALYAYNDGPVLFKPTRAAESQFRATEQTALSYFVGGLVEEDIGFAIQPWGQVRFVNEGMILRRDIALAMGNYYFTDCGTGEELKVEYTFGYQRGVDGRLLINLHHSSLPFQSEFGIGSA